MLITLILIFLVLCQCPNNFFQTKKTQVTNHCVGQMICMHVTNVKRNKNEQTTENNRFNWTGAARDVDVEIDRCLPFSFLILALAEKKNCSFRQIIIGKCCVIFHWAKQGKKKQQFCLHSQTQNELKVIAIEFGFFCFFVPIPFNLKRFSILNDKDFFCFSFIISFAFANNFQWISKEIEKYSFAFKCVRFLFASRLIQLNSHYKYKNYADISSIITKRLRMFGSSMNIQRFGRVFTLNFLRPTLRTILSFLHWERTKSKHSGWKATSTRYNGNSPFEFHLSRSRNFPNPFGNMFWTQWATIKSHKRNFIQPYVGRSVLTIFVGGLRIEIVIIKILNPAKLFEFIAHTQHSNWYLSKLSFLFTFIEQQSCE